MAIFVLADLHLSLSVNKPMTVFEGWDDYVPRIEQQWQRLVGEGDTIILVGDTSWALQLSETERDFAFIHSLPGHKIVVRGNHDYWWNTKVKLVNWVEDMGFTSIRFLFNNSYVAEGLGIVGTRGWFYDSEDAHDEKILNRELGRLRLSIESLDASSCDSVTAFLHYPPVYRDFVVAPVLEVLHEYGITRCYYGHLHGQSHAHACIGEYEGIDMQLVSADYLAFTPMKIQ